MRIKLFIAFIIGTQAAMAGGLVGRPSFCLGDKGVAMTLEFSRMHYVTDAAEPALGGEKEKIETQRGILRATFGVARGIDIDVALGTANLRFPEPPEGYSMFESDWSVAWGGGFRFGYPTASQPWQLQLSASYLGFQAEGEAVSEAKILRTSYAWQELTPAVTAGYRFGQFTPYVGVMQVILFGTRETDVEFLGAVRPGAGGKMDYTNMDQKPQALLGVDWLLPDGYYVTAQVSSSGGDQWGFSVGLAQALK